MAKFSYYRNLSAANKRIYNNSDSIVHIDLPYLEKFYPIVGELQLALESENRKNTEYKAQVMVNGFCKVMNVPKVRVRVLAKRPSSDWGEMHGLYEAEEDKIPVITVWMRTAKRKQVVAFKTFLRTIIHEFLHHLDFTLFGMDDSFHTEGFYKRESRLVKELLGEK